MRLGYRSLPVRSSPRLGQSSTVINQAAAAVVSQAEPRVRAIVQEERSQLANALIAGIPYLGASLTAFLAAQYMVPADKKGLRGIGYVGAAALFTVGAWRVLEKGSETTAPPTPPSEGGSGVMSIFGDTARQMAQVVVAEAEPKLRAIIADERSLLGQAATDAMPFIAASVAGYLATAFLVPENKRPWKFGGYALSSAALMGGLWKGLTTVAS